jgi:putative transposase
VSAAGRLDRWTRRPSKTGTGFEQPLRPHDHWHIDISYVNVAGTFYYLCSALDGCSRTLLHWDLREAIKETDVEQVIERARELYPGVSLRIITDNGPQFIAADFKTYIRLTGMTHVRTAPYYPPSNGTVGRFYKTIKGNAIRPGAPADATEARRIIGGYVRHYNTARLHSAIDYVTPADRLVGRHLAIVAERDRKLEAARERRAECRREARLAAGSLTSSPEPLDNHP